MRMADKGNAVLEFVLREISSLRRRNSAQKKGKGEYLNDAETEFHYGIKNYFETYTEIPRVKIWGKRQPIEKLINEEVCCLLSIFGKKETWVPDS
jgi:hypothetical protein